MTEAAPGIFLRPRITLSDFLRIDEIVFHLDRVKGRVRRVFLLMDLMRILITKKRVYPWDLKHLNAILTASGMLNPKAKDSAGIQGAREKITQMASDLGSKLNKFQIEVIENMTAEECEYMSLNLLVNRYEKVLDMMSAKHPSKKSFDSIAGTIGRLKSDIKNIPQKKGRAQIEGPRESKMVTSKGFGVMVGT